MDQDLTIILSRPLTAVFACLADPTRLGTWLMPQSTSYDGEPAAPTPLPNPPEASMLVPLADGDAVVEVIGHEPPRYVAFRVTTARAAHVLRVTCAADGAGTTRVHIHQSGAEQLAIDIAALDRVLHPDI